MEDVDLGETRLLHELDQRLNATFTKYFKDISLGEHTDNAVRMRATELLADFLGKRRTDINLHSDLVEIIPAPRPEDTPVDDT